ncbi:MAG: ATP-binding protein [Mariniphaga sp.]|nr:ATP-binding protein [Mariniphaga sp.]
MKKIIYQQLEERNVLLKKEYMGRINDTSKSEYLNTSLIKLITGPRRAGKSVLALQLLENQNFAYLNFDDDLLLKNFNEDAVIEGLSEVFTGYSYLLLDEIQNLPNWELWVNKLYRRGVNLIITGSNAKLLSHEMASALTGRYIQLTVLPFSFSETIRFNKQSNHAETVATPTQQGKVLSLLQGYLFNGGFPETVLNPGILKNYLTSLFDSVLLKDILKRFNVRQTQQLYDLSNYLLSNYTNLFTYNQIKESLGFRSVATVQKFMGYLYETYLFQHLKRYDAKIKNHQKAAQKIYCIDNGFIQARSFELSPNYGSLLENTVFIELLRRNYNPELDLFYYRTRNNREIDFLVRKGHKIEQLIQVCYDITRPKTLKRELDAFIEAATELNCERLLLITWDKEEQLKADKFTVQLIPAYKWLNNRWEV